MFLRLGIAGLATALCAHDRVADLPSAMQRDAGLEAGRVLPSFRVARPRHAMHVPTACGAGGAQRWCVHSAAADCGAMRQDDSVITTQLTYPPPLFEARERDARPCPTPTT